LLPSSLKYVIKFCFDFAITYWPRKQQELLNTLFQRSNIASNEGEATYAQQQKLFLKPRNSAL